MIIFTQSCVLCYSGYVLNCILNFFTLPATRGQKNKMLVRSLLWYLNSYFLSENNYRWLHFLNGILNSLTKNYTMTMRHPEGSREKSFESSFQVCAAVMLNVTGLARYPVPGWQEMAALPSLPSGTMITWQLLFSSVSTIWPGLRLGIVLEVLLNCMQFRRRWVGHRS